MWGSKSDGCNCADANLKRPIARELKTLIPAFSHERRERCGGMRCWALAGEGGRVLALDYFLPGCASRFERAWSSSSWVGLFAGRAVVVVLG